MLSKQSLLSLSLGEAFAVMALQIAVMGVGIIALGWVPHLAILLSIVLLLLYGRVRGVLWQAMSKRMAASVEQGMGAVYLFFFIGLLVSALMMSGAIPTLMYYGFNLISPQYFYLSAFLLCSLVGVAIGSSLTTCATVGVAFMGMGEAFGASAAVTAGAVVSGAFFGDKMSPLSDTTTIAAATVGVDLFEHIKNMAYTTIPAMLLSALAFAFLVPGLHSGSLDQVLRLQQHLAQSGLVHLWSLLPFALLVLMAMRKIDAVATMIAVVLLSVGLTYVYSAPSLEQLGGWFFSGFTIDGIPEDIAKLVSRGGLESMFFTQTVVILALSLGGLLFALGVVPALLAAMQRFLISAVRATFTVALTGVGVNVLIG